MMLPSKAFPTTIDTPRVRLCQPTMALAPAIFAAIDAERERLRTYLPWVRYVKTVADEEAFVMLSASRWAKHEQFGYAMLSPEDGTYLGNCGLVAVHWEHHYAEIGYWIRGGYEGQGLVSEAVQALEGVAKDVGMHRLEIHCSTQNARSCGVPLRLGYALEGVCREDFFTDGGFHDTAIYGKVL